MSKNIKNEQYDCITATPEEFQNTISEILETEGYDSTNKKIIKMTIGFLKYHGILLKGQDNQKDEYVYFETGQIFSLKSREFKFFLNEITTYRPKSKYITNLIENLEMDIYRCGNEIEKKNFSFYDTEKNTLYIKNSQTTFIKITEDNIDICKNGTDNIIFQHCILEKWELLTGITENHPNYIQKLVESINFKATSELSKKEIVFLLEGYVKSIFFNSLLKTKPILILFGEAGSGKSFFLEILKKILFGEKINLDSLPTTIKDFNNFLSSNFLGYIDNVDGAMGHKYVDKLCTAATGGSFSQRKLFTDNNNVSYEYNNFIGITTRTPKFNRDDLADRSIILKLERRNDYSSSALVQNSYLENRNKILTSLCLEIQQHLINLKEYNNYETQFRMSDFSIFLKNIYKENQEYIENLFLKLIKYQKSFSNHDNPFFVLLESICEKYKGFRRGNTFSISQLHDKFDEFSRMYRHIGGYPFNSTRSLGKFLSSNKETILEDCKVQINVSKTSGNKSVYEIFAVEENETTDTNSNEESTISSIDINLLG